MSMWSIRCRQTTWIWSFKESYFDKVNGVWSLIPLCDKWHDLDIVETWPAYDPYISGYRWASCMDQPLLCCMRYACNLHTVCMSMWCERNAVCRKPRTFEWQNFEQTGQTLALRPTIHISQWLLYQISMGPSVAQCRRNSHTIVILPRILVNQLTTLKVIYAEGPIVISSLGHLTIDTANIPVKLTSKNV